MSETNDQDQGKKAQRKKLVTAGPLASAKLAGERLAELDDDRLEIWLITGWPEAEPAWMVASSPRRAVMQYVKEMGLKVTKDEAPTPAKVKALLDGLSPEDRAALLKDLAQQGRGAATTAPRQDATKQVEIPGAEPEQQRRDKKGTSRGAR